MRVSFDCFLCLWSLLTMLVSSGFWPGFGLTAAQTASFQTYRNCFISSMVSHSYLALFFTSCSSADVA